MGKVKVKILVDNCTAQADVLAEHGFSMLVEEADSRILFDTGATNVLVHNSKVYNLDLSEITDVVLSHGHDDHTGGMRYFLPLNERCRVVCGKGYNVRRCGTRGTDISFPAELVVPNDRLCIADDVLQLSDSVFVVSARESKINTFSHIGGFFRFPLPDQKEVDDFEDELFIVVKREQGLVLCSGCAHRGIINLIDLAEQKFGIPVVSVVGGMHTVNDSEEQIKQLCDEIEAKAVSQMICCHCTGVNSFAKVAVNLPNVEVKYATVGNNLVF